MAKGREGRAREVGQGTAVGQCAAAQLGESGRRVARDLTRSRNCRENKQRASGCGFECKIEQETYLSCWIMAAAS